jgi:hypothetical protein
MRKGFVRLSEHSDCRIVAENMRQADIAEIKANSNGTPLNALNNGFTCSLPCFTIIKQPDIPVGMFGTVPMSPAAPRTGMIWMLGTDELWDIRFVFLRESKYWLNQMSKGYDFVYNVIDKRNELHLKWLEWLGFKFIREIPEYGVEGRPFLEFVRYNNV